MVLEQPDIHMQKKLDSCFISYIKINSKCVDLTVRARSIKLLGKKSINVYLYDSVLGNDFLDMTSKAQGTKQIN